ncbi:hypothetical protein PCE1_003005 [Barthelona sp. PCE]
MDSDLKIIFTDFKHLLQRVDSVDSSTSTAKETKTLMSFRQLIRTETDFIEMIDTLNTGVLGSCIVGLLKAVVAFDLDRLEEAKTLMFSVENRVLENSRDLKFHLIVSKYAYYRFLIFGTEAYNFLLDMNRTAIVGHDELTQMVTINCIFNILIQQGQYKKFKNTHSNFKPVLGKFLNQDARYFYYTALLSISLTKYRDAAIQLNGALRKTNNRQLIMKATKLLVVLKLLLGDSDKSLFRDAKAELYPYYMLDQAVASGDLINFNACLSEFEHLFEADNTLKIILSLKSAVVRIGVANMAKAYSKISLEGCARLLGLDSVEEVLSVVSKLISNNEIDAKMVLVQQGVFLSFGDERSIPIQQTIETFNAKMREVINLRNECIKSIRYTDRVSVDEDEIKRMDEQRKLDLESQHMAAQAEDHSEPHHNM